MFNLNVDFAVECVKSITDNTQCVTCDKLIGPCVRFPCGHSLCESCGQKSGECLTCTLSPAEYQIDNPQTVRLKNAANLLSTFQHAFNIDVYRRQRISDHLKVERQVFPECIQAPHKYINNRKSHNISFNDKENIDPKVFPGEGIGYSTVIMKKSVQYVQNWLNKYESISQNQPRRPFGDINVNTQSLVQKANQDVMKPKHGHSKAKRSTYKKRSHLKSIHKTDSLLNNVVKKSEDKNILRQDIKETKKSNLSHKSDKNESGIVMDDDLMVIEDEDTNTLDKDEQAWLAVLEAAKKDEYEIKDNNYSHNERTTNKSVDDIYKITSSRLPDNKEESDNNKTNTLKIVPFYKKSPLSETCKLCNDYFKTKINNSSKVHKSNDVSIVINNSEFITTIKFTHCDAGDKTVADKNSVAIQTDEVMPVFKKELINNNCDRIITSQKRKNVINNDVVPTKMLKNDISHSLDIFGTDKGIEQNSGDNSLKQRSCVVIEESDTDSNVTCDNIQEVEVEVHRMDAPDNFDCGILRTLSKEEYKHKTKRQVRGNTPNSSNSSDKENLDPNRKKALRFGKKRKNKK